jgi:membrane protein YdbS with pleckstrin-like domain
MSGTLILLAITWAFWLILTVGLACDGKSWFPFTVVAPLLLSVIGFTLERWHQHAGVAFAAIVHGAMIALMVIATLWNGVAVLWKKWHEKKKADSRD